MRLPDLMMGAAALPSFNNLNGLPKEVPVQTFLITPLPLDNSTSWAPGVDADGPDFDFDDISPFINLTAMGLDQSTDQMRWLGVKDQYFGDYSQCVDAAGANPPAHLWDHPGWKYTDLHNCQAKHKLDANGQCFHALKQTPSDICASWCITSHGWFHGAPIDLHSGDMCQPGDGCSRSLSLSYSDNVNTGTTWVEGTSRTIGESRSHTRSHTNAFGISETFSQGLFGVADHSTSLSWTFSWSEAHAFTFSDSVSKSNSVQGTVGRSYGLSIGASISNARGGAEDMSYCASWYAIPKIFYRCGVGSWAKKIESDGGVKCQGDTSMQKPICEIWAQKVRPSAQAQKNPKGAQNRKDFEHQQDFSGETVQHSVVMVKRDCENGEILPGAWQPKPFAQWINFLDYYSEHFSRYKDWFRPTYTEANRLKNLKDQKGMFGAATHFNTTASFQSTRTIGPDDYTINVCLRKDLDGPHNWCSRYKLEDNKCMTFSAGATEYPFVKIKSAETAPGNCCVLFSKHECLGRPQRIVGRIDNFREYNFDDVAHSVICNVAEYCDGYQENMLG